MLILILLLSLSSSLAAYVEGYDRFIAPQTGKVIDLLHDAHVPEKRLSRRDFKHKSCSYIEKRLYPSEKRFMQALHVINENAPNKCDVVWEQGKHEGYEKVFIANAKRLVDEQLLHIHLIRADFSRDCFEELLLNKRRRVLHVTFEDPVPLSEAMIMQIKVNAGKDGWDAYKKYHKKTIDRLHDAFGKDHSNGVHFHEEDFYEHRAFDSLADIEMLSHILASSKPHVIVYAGGWHSQHIAKFLKKKLGYDHVASFYSRSDEIQPQVLDLIHSQYTQESRK